ncbi:hypothetical protein E2562_000860 [Oryza meyeriana var. granulata]|uniref:Uncharacterized protein n=1 Tax=Oryza meyeriana var. granulata TaxID=110450 RepID=A0A6G1CY42_9ORYZ|nr:hypothetical protein E2562_000860 [Oryza meyeriana var. granulata]
MSYSCLIEVRPFINVVKDRSTHYLRNKLSQAHVKHPPIGVTLTKKKSRLCFAYLMLFK